MTRITRSASLAGLALLALAAAPAAKAGSVTVTVDGPMNFGTVIAPPEGGTVQVSTAGAVTGPGSFLFKGFPAAGQFTASGVNNALVTITFSGSSVLTGPGSPMTIDGFTHNAGASPTLDASGKLVFRVGARLTVNPGQQGGTYTGTFTVTVG